MKFLSFARSLIRLFVICTLAFAFVMPNTLLAGVPNGAKKLTKKNIFQTKDEKGKKFFCGKIGKKFIPGKKTSGYFYSHQAEIKNLQTKLKKTKKKKQKENIKKQINTLKGLIASRKDICLGKKEKVALRFDFSGAVGVAISEKVNSYMYTNATVNEASSNLKKVDSLGNLKEAIVSGKAEISQYFVAPNNKLYVLFQQKLNINDVSNLDCSNNQCCLLAEINATTGEALCIDSTLDEIYWNNGYGADRPIQFDNTGAIYYLGFSSGEQILRKYTSNGASTFTNLTSTKMVVDKFLVLYDGSILVTGNSGFYWLRKIPASGKGVIQLYSDPDQFNIPSHLYVLSDENIYLNNAPLNGWYCTMCRLPQNFNSFDERQAWIGPLFEENVENCKNYNFAIDCFFGTCSAQHEYDPKDCGWDLHATYISPKGKVFEGLYQWYPKTKSFHSLINNIILLQGVDENFIIYGLDSNRQEQITIYNTDTDKETQLLEPGKFSPYSFIYIPSSNTIMFDALRYEDGEYVIGQINLDTREVTSTPAGNVRLINFQAFN